MTPPKRRGVVYFGVMVFEDDVPKSFHKFRNDAIRSLPTTRGDNVKQIWIKKVKIEVIEESLTP